jgi:hypothetical protein
MERLLLLTEPFTWEGIPTRDPYTGYLTMAAWIPRINIFAQNIYALLVFIHFIYVFFRSMFSEGRVLQFNSWYPFETLTSPQYELVNVTQVQVPTTQEPLFEIIFIHFHLHFLE